MSELVTLTTGASATIYGTLGEAIAYISLKSSDEAKAWGSIAPDDQKRSLVDAMRFIDQHVWVDDFDTFAKRDALPAFPQASYEMAVLVNADPDVLTAIDAGSNIQSVVASGAGVTYFNPTSATSGSATSLPTVLERLIGQYLAASDVDISVGAGDGQSGLCVGVLHRDDFKRWEPL